MMAGTAPSNQSLYDLFAVCLASYKKLILALTKENCSVICSGHVDVTRNLEEYGRVRIWGDQSRVTLPPKVRGSLDDTLRHDTQLKDTVHRILDQLRWCLDQAIPIAERNSDAREQGHLNSIVGMSDDFDSENENENEDESDECYTCPEVPNIAWLVHHVFEQIDSLFHVSSLLRRPTYKGKYIRSVSQQATARPHQEEDGLFTRADREHVSAKIRQWYDLAKSPQGGQSGLESPVSQDQIRARANIGSKFGNDVLVLSQRLASANTRRREQLQYWIEKQDDPELRDSHAHLEAEARENLVPASRNAPATELSKMSLSTVVRSDVFETHSDSGRPRTEYTQSLATDGGPNRVLDALIPNGPSLFFTCPYCRMELISSEMRDRQTWMRHVFRDLRPYVCTFSECQNPGKLYLTRNDWIYHEIQMHRRQFVCSSCGEKRPNRHSMVTHLQSYHSSQFSPIQIPLLLGMCERPVEDNEQSLCLCCGQEMCLSKLQKHLATHMEDIALFVLPVKVGDDTQERSGSSIQAVKQMSWTDVGSDGTPPFDSLQVSDLERKPAHNHTLADILGLEEPEVGSKIATWQQHNSHPGYSSTVPSTGLSEPILESVEEPERLFDGRPPNQVATPPPQHTAVQSPLTKQPQNYSQSSGSPPVDSRYNKELFDNSASFQVASASTVLDITQADSVPMSDPAIPTSHKSTQLQDHLKHDIPTLPQQRSLITLNEGQTLDPNPIKGGSMDEYERLDRRKLPFSCSDFIKADWAAGYFVRHGNEAERFFVVGRLFALLWHEGQGENGTEITTPFRSGIFNEPVISKIRRMVVVRPRHGSSWCCPVVTYEGKGVTKQGFSNEDVEAHAIVYMSGTEPFQKPEERLIKQPLKFHPISPEQRLDPMSRLNFGKFYAVEHNVKVMEMGIVARSSIAYLSTYLRDFFNAP